MNIGILTSSRADFGIYLPLLKKIRQDDSINLKLIVFGSHLSRFHGYTLSEIESEGFVADYQLETLLIGDTPEAISTSISLCTMKFAQFWGAHSAGFNAVFCLGDRYEMFAAVSSGASFGIKFVHLHGGEQTLGAIDNFFRHAISHSAWCHFTSTQQYAERLKQMLDVKERIYFVGALSLDSLVELKMLTTQHVQQRWNVDMDKPYILVTFHPETINANKNKEYALELVGVCENLNDIQIVMSLPNSDTAGSTLRSIFMEKLTPLPNVTLSESFGSIGYFTLMKNCTMLLGNSSSGIIEAASFGKYVINIGDRQKGRMDSGNVLHTPIEKNSILEAIQSVKKLGPYRGENVYYQPAVSDQIIKIIKNLLPDH